MSIRDLAAKDIRAIVARGDVSADISIVTPDGGSFAIKAIVNDIGQRLDPETGGYVTSNDATCTFVLQDLYDAGVQIPYGVMDESEQLYTLSFNSVAGVQRNFSIKEVMPDRTVGMVVCMLSEYQP